MSPTHSEASNDRRVHVDALDRTSLDDPASALELIAQQQSSVVRRRAAGIPWILAVWGVAWLLGFLALWSADDAGNPWLRLPAIVAGSVVGVAMVGAIVISAVLGARVGRGVRGESGFVGLVYGASWMLGLAVAAATALALARQGVEADVLVLFLPAAYALITGLIHLMGAALWRSVDQVALGAIVLVAGAAAPLFGAPTNLLVMALVGGAALLLASLAMAASLRRGSAR